MSNSGLVEYTKYSPHQRGKKTHAIDRITPHCVVGQCTIEALGAEFSKATKNASSNYGIDKDGRIGLFVDEDCRAITSSSSENDNRSITIECASDVSAPWAFRDIVWQRLIELCIDICKRNGKTKLLWFGDKEETLNYNPKADEMVLSVHRWFSNRACPGDWCYSRLGELADRVTDALKPKTAVHWYDDAMAWAETVGLIKDGRPNDSVTRAELATVLMRYHYTFNGEDSKSESGLLS